MGDELASRVAAVAALDEPTRRRLYEHVARQTEPVGRDEVAAACDVPRGTVAFHLDKLVTEGLLTVTFERRTHRTGPGAGRPAKLYRRSARQVRVSLPESRYDLAGQLLAAAIEEADGSTEPVRTILARHARQVGATLSGTDAIAALAEHGFEPRQEGDHIVLGNCPFHALATTHPDLVCGMTLHLVDGMLTDDPARTARLVPRAGHCCVQLDPRQARRPLR
jgi:predicted ArsR family transcriptional regulator